jgi:hypothetical protein
MEIIIGVLICAKIIVTAIAAYFFAEARADKRLIERQSEWLEVERKEKLEWASKALARTGQKPLHHVPEKTVDPTPARRVVTRAEARDRTSETIEKAKEILNK